MVFVLSVLLVLGLSVAIANFYKFIPSIAIRWFLALVIPYLLTDAWLWIYDSSHGGCDVECDAWNWFRLFPLYIPSYIASAVIVFKSRWRVRISGGWKNRAQVHAPLTANLFARETYALILAPLVLLLLTPENSDLIDRVGTLLGAYLAVTLFGLPTYLLFKNMGWTLFRHFVGLGVGLGIFLPLITIWLNNPSAWKYNQAIFLQEDLVNTFICILCCTIVSALFWLLAYVPVFQWLRKWQRP